MAFLKKMLILCVIAGAAYTLLSYHFIMINNSVKLLKKSHLTLEYTIFSTMSKTNKAILAIDELREDGIGELLLEAGKITEDELERLISMYEEEDS